MPGRNPGEPGEAREEELLDALEEIFQKEGFRRVTVAELASRLHRSRRSFYELAGSKEKLFLRVLGRLLARVRQMGDDAVDALAQPGDQLEAYLRPGFEETLHASTAFFADIESFPAARQMMDKHQATRVEGIRRIIEAGVRRGQLDRADPYLISEVARVVARRFKEPDFLQEASFSAGEAFQEWTQLLLHGLLHPTETKKKQWRR